MMASRSALLARPLFSLLGRRATPILTHTQPRPLSTSLPRRDLRSLLKNPAFLKDAGVNIVKILFVVEGVCFMASYAFYRKLNRDPEYRFSLATDPTWFVLVEYYYKIGEYMDPACPIRANDLQLWRDQGKIN